MEVVSPSPWGIFLNFVSRLLGEADQRSDNRANTGSDNRDVEPNQLSDVFGRQKQKMGEDTPISPPIPRSRPDTSLYRLPFGIWDNAGLH